MVRFGSFGTSYCIIVIRPDVQILLLVGTILCGIKMFGKSAKTEDP